MNLNNRINLFGLIFENIRRKPYRSILIGVCVALATGSLFAITILMLGVKTSLAVGRARLGADLVVVPVGNEVSAQESFITGQPSTFYFSGSIEAQVAAVEGVALTSAQVYVESLNNASCCIGEFFLVGYDPETDFTISPWLKTHLSNDTIASDQVIVGDRILLRTGNSARFYGTRFTVAGVLEKTGMGIDRTIYIPLEGIRQMVEASEEKAEKRLTISPDEISSIMVKVEPDADMVDVAERIEQDVPSVQAFTTSQLNQSVDRQLQGILGVVLSIMVAFWVMSLVTIGLVYSLVVNERQRELGLLRAMGARKGFILRLVMSEASLLTGLSSLVGVAGALILMLSFSRLIQLRLQIPYLLPPLLQIAEIALGLIILALVFGGLASLLPALTSSRMEVYEAIRQGE
jgi:putative ABC transport system permease protein